MPVPLVQKGKTVFASKRIFASLHCRASLAFSRSSASVCWRKSGRVCSALAIFSLAVTGRPDLFWCNAQRFSDQSFAFWPVAVKGIRLRGGRQPGLTGQRRQRSAPLSQPGDNVGGMPVLLHHAVTSSINFTPSAVRIQRGALSSAAKHQTSSHSNPVSVCSIVGSSACPVRSCSSVSE